jgi:hypothetical protein
VTRVSADSYMLDGGTWQGRGESTHLVKWNSFGWEFFSYTVDEWINFYGNGTGNGSWKRF